MTTFDPFTPAPNFPIHAMTAGERKAMQRQADEERIIRQAKLVTRISAAQLGLDHPSRPTTQQVSSRRDYLRKMRRRHIRRAIASYLWYFTLGIAAALIALGIAWGIVTLFGHHH